MTCFDIVRPFFIILSLAIHPCLYRYAADIVVSGPP